MALPYIMGGSPGGRHARISGWEIAHRAVGESPLAPLAHLAPRPDADPPRWSWAVARIDGAGRVPLPAPARRALDLPRGTTGVATGICHRIALVLGVDGPPMAADARGRLLLPAWLRAAAPAVVIGTWAESSPLVVVAPSRVLDGFGDVLGRLR